MEQRRRMIRVGPVGKSDPNNRPIEQWDEGGRTEISQIIISGGIQGITSIQFQYFEENKFVLSNVFGQSSHSGDIFHSIELKYPKEYITGVSGEYTTETFAKWPRIRALKFTTNLRDYGPFGRPIGFAGSIKFTFSLGNSPQFGGFHGMYDANGLHSIGVYFRPKTFVLSKTNPTNIPEEKASIIALDP